MMMTKNAYRLGGVAAALALLAGTSSFLVQAADDRQATSAPVKTALTVSVTSAAQADWAQTLQANGSVAAWQETVVGAELSGLRLAEVQANVGDRVKRGQLLAQLSADSVKAELAQSRAGAAEAQATLAEAQANAERARSLQTSGAISASQVQQYLTAAATAKARLEAAQARVQADELRLSQTRIVANDDGVISARAATAGSMVQPGQELFRLIRKGRLEWRAEVPADELSRLSSGMAVRVNVSDKASGAAPVNGKVRMVAPTVDPQTRMGLVYVDLDSANSLRAGTFARGEFQLARSQTLSLPQTAVLLRDGFSYVYRVGADNRVTRLKVQTGRRLGDRIEVLGGVDAAAKVVTSGAGFLSEGDAVRVVAAPVAPAPVAAAAPTTVAK
ncbi:RND family efflux transporter MFP subunit [Roseateles toxinivorans]|uniref:RND family efflux transporter MFP subunit n=2 Tax=Roseateles toxinivorans TaxID=270368 RepID=A0A4R6QNY7_9BURK|nr:RND family efflux transporter MFP subunit [Roseateles toxinivorans]